MLDFLLVGAGYTCVLGGGFWYLQQLQRLGTQRLYNPAAVTAASLVLGLGLALLWRVG